MGRRRRSAGLRLLGRRSGQEWDDYSNGHAAAGDMLDYSMAQTAWRQHDGGGRHPERPNWKYFIPWQDKMMKRDTGKK